VSLLEFPLILAETLGYDIRLLNIELQDKICNAMQVVSQPDYHTFVCGLIPEVISSINIYIGLIFNRC
jgi:hypothetical protein